MCDSPTFHRLYAECLTAAREAYTELSDPVQYRLIRAVAEHLELAHYAPLIDRRGFIGILEDMIGELNAARVWPEAFIRALTALGDAVLGPRDSEQPRTQSWRFRFLD